VFSSAKCFETNFRKFSSIFVSQNKILSCFLLRGIVRNGIPRVSFFCSKVMNSEHFSLPRNGSERNSESLLLLCSTVQNSEHFSLPRNSLEWNSESFLFRGTAGIPSEQTICFVYSVFRTIFLSEFPNLLSHMY
jgi:hypothetical protein